MKHKLYGTEIKRRELLRRVGDISQVAGAQRAVLTDGKGKDVRVVNAKTGTGLAFTVVPDRGMDIAWAEYKGMAISFISKTGVVHPNAYDKSDDEFHRSFFAGLLTTCGLRNIGPGCEDGGERLGLHGRIDNTPAQDVCTEHRWIDENTMEMSVRGVVSEAKLYGENLQLHREITAVMGTSTIRIRDVVENLSFTEETLTILYHCNFGYPLLDAESRLYLPKGAVTARDAGLGQSTDGYDNFQEPQTNYPETVYFHDSNAGSDGWTQAVLYNPALSLGVRVRYKKDTLPYLIEWKNMGNGDYVLALEPANCYPQGRSCIRKNGMLQSLAPFEKREFEVEMQVIEGEEALSQCLLE